MIGAHVRADILPTYMYILIMFDYDVVGYIKCQFIPLRARVIFASTVSTRVTVVCLYKSNKTSTRASIAETTFHGSTRLEAWSSERGGRYGTECVNLPL